MLETHYRQSTSIRLTAKQECDAYTISFNERKKVRNASREKETKQRPIWQ